MRKAAIIASLILLCTMISSCASDRRTGKLQVIEFSMEKVAPGRKIDLKEFDRDFPEDWSPYNYLVLDMSCSTGQRVYVGLDTEYGYNELRIIFYAPNGRIRTVIPLTYFRDLPAGAHDLAATYNHRRPLSYINIDHGTRCDLKGVEALGFRMNNPVKDEKIVVYDAYLTVDDPGDTYLHDVPAIDEFGQWNLGEFEGKIHSEAELKAEWAEEEAAVAAFKREGRSQYGGDLSRRTEATGYFNVAKIDGKWWFVDPEGYQFISISSNGISPGNSSVYNPLEGVYTNVAPEGYKAPEMPANPNMTRRRRGDRPNVDSNGNPLPDVIIPFSEWNRYRRYGAENAREKAAGFIVDRMDFWGMNTIGNWSDRGVIALGRKPFMISLGGLGINSGILGMPDVYAEGFAEMIDEGVRRSVEPYVNNRMLIGYFVGNEPTWSNKEMRLCELIMEADDEMPLKQALVTWKAEHGDTPESLKKFVYLTFEIFLSNVKTALEKYDPNHLNLGIRYGSGVPAPEVLELSKMYFDVYSFNNYGIDPDIESIDKIYQATDMPMIIGEFHFGTTDRGLGESLVRVTSQEARGTAYRNYCEKAFSHPALIGTSWFTWYDQPLFGRNDGENYNIGLLDATDRPYEWMIKAIQEVERNCYDVHDGDKTPFSQTLERVGGKFIDRWD